MTDTQQATGLPATASGESSGTVSEVTDHAKQLASHAGDEISTVVGATREQAKGVVAGARSQIAGEADRVTGRAADALAGTARDLSDLASGNVSPDSQAAQLVRQAAERVDTIATRLSDRGYEGVADDVSRWARAHPGTFLAAAAGAGFLIGRVFRSSDTKALVDAAKGSSAGNEPSMSSGAPQLEAGDPSLFAEERRTDLSGAPTAPPIVEPIEPIEPIDLTEPMPGPIAGV